jgi:hypothetical protein
MSLASPEHRLFVHRIAEAWAEGSEAPSQPEGTLWRGSQAGMCARMVAYQTLGVEKTNPPSTADYWRMGLGSVVHELLEPAVKNWLAKDDTVTVEEEISVKLGKHGNGHIDMVMNTAGGQKIVLELKTINGFGYKMAVEKGEGPRHSHILQGAMYAKAMDADMLVIGYLAMENISPSRARSQGIDDIGRFATEWHYPKSYYMPLADQETDRLEGIALQAHAEGALSIPRRFSHSDPDIPFPAEINDPSTGRWMLDNRHGKAWQCGYCDYHTRCISDME